MVATAPFHASVAYAIKNNVVSDNVDLFSERARVVARDQQKNEGQSTLDLHLRNVLIA